jgi:small-conductance mechanosensitive channel
VPGLDGQRRGGMTDILTEQFGLAPTLSSRLLSTVVVIAVIIIVRYLAARIVHRRVSDPELEFRSRKAITYIATVIFVVSMVFIWLPFFDNLATFLGLVSAGVAIALADVFLNLAGWTYIVFRRPFRVGDRIEISGNAGDVVDIRAFRFTLLEIRDWVHADQSTGRIIHVPNGKLFRDPVANFTEGFHYIWHEIPVLVTFESDWERAEAMIRRALSIVAIPEAEARNVIKEMSASRDYRITYRQLSPTVYVSTRDSGVLLTGRVLVEARRRRSVEDAVWRALLTEMAGDASVELAYPTIRGFVPEMYRDRSPGATGGDATGS